MLEEIEEAIGIDSNEAVSVSAKTGLGIDELLEAIVDKIPPPSGKRRSFTGTDSRLLV